MRTRLENNEQIRSASVSIPPPIGGLNAKDALENMPVTDAVKLTNLIPDTTTVDLRKGYTVHTSAGVHASPVESLFTYAPQNGSDQLIATASSGIFDCTTASSTASTIGSGFTNAQWSATMINNKLLMCNGADQPQRWDGSTLTASSITGASTAQYTKFSHVGSYQSRAYFVEDNSSSVWYGGVGSTAGSFTEFDVQNVAKMGGKLLWSTDWTLDAGDGVQNYYVLMSDQGEALIYTGSYPGDSAWSLQSRVVIPKPLGRRSYINMGSDLWVLTEQGIIPMSAVLSGQFSAGAYEAVTDKIQDVFNAAAKSYRSNFGWAVVNHRGSKHFIVNVPTAVGSNYEQYLMNTLTGAWCKIEGLKGVSWAAHNNQLFFGGLSGDVYQADNGDTDNGAAIDFSGKLAFNYHNDRASNKMFTMARPLVSASGAMEFGFGLDVDFEDVAPVQAVTVTAPDGAIWDTGLWDSAIWSDGNATYRDWASVTGIGRASALKIGGQVKNVSFSLSGFNLIYTSGGYL